MIFNNSARRDRLAGFTLIEVLITISIVAIATAIALPSFRTTMMTSTTRAIASDLVSSLNLARTEAVKRGRAITVGAAGTEWTAGWTVKAGSDELQRFVPDRTGYVVKATAATVDFAADGVQSGSNPADVTIDICPLADKTLSRRIVVSRIGSISTTPSPASTCA